MQYLVAARQAEEHGNEVMRNDSPEANPIRDFVNGVVADYAADGLTMGEGFEKLLSAATPANIGTLVAVLPEQWREAFVEYMRGFLGSSSSDTWVTIEGGSFTWEKEPSVEERERQRAEHERTQAAARERFILRVVPAVESWFAHSNRTGEKS